MESCSLVGRVVASDDHGPISLLTRLGCRHASAHLAKSTIVPSSAKAADPFAAALRVAGKRPCQAEAAAKKNEDGDRTARVARSRAFKELSAFVDARRSRLRKRGGATGSSAGPLRGLTLIGCTAVNVTYSLSLTVRTHFRCTPVP